MSGSTFLVVNHVYQLSYSWYQCFICQHISTCMHVECEYGDTNIKQFISVSVPQAWDLGYGFDMGVLYKSGWFVFFGSMLTAASLAYFL